MRFVARVALAAVLALIATSRGNAQAIFHGFAQVNSTARATGEECPPEMACDIIRAEERVQLALDLSTADGRAGAVVRVDAFHDAIRDDGGVDLREAFIDLTGRRFSARAGRQIVTWGLGDLLFINDVFPKDWDAFLTGAPIEYLKFGSDAVKLGAYRGSAGVEAVVTPVFAPDRAPSADRLFYFDPMTSVTDRRTIRPSNDFDHMQLAGRLYTQLGRFEVAGYVSKGFFGMPAGRPDPDAQTPSLLLVYPRLNTVGASLQGPLSSGVFSVETGYYDSQEDRPGTDPTVENSQIRALAAYQFQPKEDLTLGFQYYGELMRDHGAYVQTLPQGFPAKDRVRQVASVRVSQLRRHQTVRLNLLVMASPTDRDAYINPSIRYNVSDELWVETGANVFVGQERHTFFGQFEKNSSLFVTARYAF